MANVGEKFPSFTTESHEGETVDIESYRGGKKLVVFFYPRASTPGCVRETTEFAARRAEFDALDTVILGVSVDSVEAQKKHAITCAANFPVLAKGKPLVEQLGIASDSGSAKRTTFVVGQDGAIKQVFEGVKVDGHVDEVLAAVKAL